MEFVTQSQPGCMVVFSQITNITILTPSCYNIIIVAYYALIIIIMSVSSQIVTPGLSNDYSVQYDYLLPLNMVVH